MRIVFLGTSHGYPEPNRKCSSAMIEIGESCYIIDMGCDAINELINRGIKPDSVKGIFITHMHGDHTNGLVSYLELACWMYKTADPEIFIPGSCEDVRACLNTWFKLNGSPIRDFRFNEVKEGIIFDDGVLKVTAFRTKHYAISYAYLIEAEGKYILFSGDLSKNPSDDFPHSALELPLELAVLEAAHFSAKEYINILNGKGSVKRVCFNHYSIKCAEDIEDIGYTIKALEQPVVLATDNLEFNF